MHRGQGRESRKRKKQGNIFQTKKQDKYPETNLIKEISDLPNRELKMVVIKVQ